METLAEAYRLIQVVENGKVEWVPARQLAFRRFMFKAINGDLKAAEFVFEQIRKSLSACEWKNHELFRTLEQKEKHYEEWSKIVGEEYAFEELESIREKTRR